MTRDHLASLVCAAMLSVAVIAATTSAVDVGFAQVDVTPPEGVPMAGYYEARYSTGTHDPLFAKTMVVRDGDATAAIVALDLISTNKPLVDRVRALAKERFGWDGPAVMITATHAHTGPVLSLAGRDSFVESAAAEKLQGYLDRLPDQILQSIQAAVDAAVPAKLYRAMGHCPDLGFNRRFFMADGSVGWNPGKNNPDTLRPAGPTDDSVPILYVTDAEDRPLGMLVNFAMHLDTVGGDQMSADYPFVLAELISRWQGEGFVTMFAIGCAGDINHLNVKWGDRQKGINEATRIGTVLAGSVMQALLNKEPIGDDGLRFASRIVRLRTPTITDADIKAAQQVRSELDAAQRVPFLQQVEAFKVLDVQAAGGQITAEIQVIRLGQDLAWVGLPGEVFVELGLDLKNASPATHTFIAELSGGSIGYIPTRRAYREGNYEVVSARVGEGSGEIMVETALDLLTTLSSH